MGTVMNESRRQILLDTPHTETATGAIASFETDMVGRAKEVKVEIEPVQEGTPWIADTTESVPYNFRAVKGTAPRIGNSIFESVVGGTVAWNQWTPIKSSALNYNSNGAHITDNRDGSYTFYTDETGATSNILYQVFQIVDAVIPGHVYMLAGNYPHDNGATTWRLVDAYNVALPWPTTKAETLFKNQRTTIARMDCRIQIFSGTIIATPITVRPQVFDLTQMFGTAVADYLSSLETATPDAGVDRFRSLFPEDYYEYNPGELISVEGVSSHETVGFNQWDEEWELGSINLQTGENTSSSAAIRSKNYIPIVPGQAYYVKKSGLNIGFRLYDANKGYLGYLSANTVENASSFGDNVCFIRFVTNSTTVYNPQTAPICINLSDPTRNGEYEPYVKHSYPLDSSLTLRGIPKMDANNRLYYDGDTYESDGTVERRYGVVDLRELTWVSNGQDSVFANLPQKKVGSRNVICDKLTYSPAQSISSVPYNGFRTYDASNGIAVRVSGITPGNAKDNLSGMMLVYELATPTTETADPFQSPQVIDEYGTEEYVYSGTRDVAIPVGHVTRHADIYPISGFDGLTLFQKGRGSFANRFRQLEYIETSGTEAFDTGVAPFEGFGFEVTFLAKSPVGTSAYGCIFGGRVTSGTKDFQLTTYESSPTNHGTLRYGTSSPVIGAKITSGVKQTASLKNLIYTAPTGETTTVQAYTAFEGAKNLYLHALNNSGTVTQGGSGCRIYSFIIYNGSDVYREFLPCERVADGAIGYYERVTGEFITALSGTPVAGPYVVSPFPISWSSSAGTIYGGYLTWLWDGTVKLTKTMESVDLGTLTWNKFDASGGNYILGSLGGDGWFFRDKVPLSVNPICSSYIGGASVPSNYAAYIRGNGRVCFYNGPDRRFYLRDDALIGLSTAKVAAALSGVQLVYELATPQTYTLTPQEALVFLRGTNHVWNDINDTTVTYWTHKTGDSV